MPASLAGGVLRMVEFSVPKPIALSTLGFYSAQGQSPPAGVRMALYANTYSGPNGTVLTTSHPTKRLAVTTEGFRQGKGDGWWRASMGERDGNLMLGNGTYCELRLHNVSPFGLCLAFHRLLMIAAGGRERERERESTHCVWDRPGALLPSSGRKALADGEGRKITSYRLCRA